MSKLLAENLLRFGAKGVSENMLKSYLAEQTVVSREIYNTVAGEIPLNNLATYAQTYNPTSGYIRIINGNQWLAQQRANSLYNFLDTNLIKQFAIPFNKEVSSINQVQVLGPEPENQRTVATLQAKLKIVIPKQEYKYQILYNFYEIGDQPYIIVTNNKVHTPGYDITSQRRALEIAKTIPGAIPIKQSTGGSLAGQQTQFTAAILIPIDKNSYADKSGPRLYFADDTTYNAVRDLIKKYTDLANFKETGTPGKGLAMSNFSETQGGGGDYIIGKRGSATATRLDNNDKLTIVRGPESGEGAGKAVKGTDITDWTDIGTITLDNTQFEDNQISIPNAQYQKVFSDIQNMIDKLSIEKKYEPVEFKTTIQGYSSSRNATNRVRAGITPDHTWGNRIQINQWITV